MENVNGYMKITVVFAMAIMLLCGVGSTHAAGGNDLSKADLYGMIQDLQGELRSLKADRGQDAPGAERIRAIVEEEVTARAPKAEEEGLMDRIQIHGSLSQGYLQSNHNSWLGETEDGTFNFNEMAFNISADLTDKLRAGLQIMSRDIGPMVNNDVRLDWAILDYAWRDELGLRIGVLKCPRGLYNESRDIDGARIGILLPQGVYGENARELYNAIKGFGIYGNLDLIRAGSLNYQVVYGDQDLDKNGEIANNTMGRGLIDAGSVSEITTDHTVALALTWDTPMEGLRLNSTYYQADLHLKGEKTWLAGHPFAGTHSVEATIEPVYAWNVGAEYGWNDLVMAAEYGQTRSVSELHISGNLAAAATVSSELWYVSASYRFNDWFAGEINYSEVYPDKDDKNGDRLAGTPGNEKFYAWAKIWSINGRFDINDYWSVKVAVNLNDGMANGFNFQNPDGAEKDWILYQLKASVSF